MNLTLKDVFTYTYFFSSIIAGCNAVCTLPNFMQNSSWIDQQTSVTLTFGTSSLSGLSINARGSILKDYTCISTLENVVVFKSGNSYTDLGRNRWIYLCMKITKLSDNLLYFYLLSDVDTTIVPNYRVFNPKADAIPSDSQPTCKFCEFTTKPFDSEYHLLKKVGTDESLNVHTPMLCLPCNVTTCDDVTASTTFQSTTVTIPTTISQRSTPVTEKTTYSVLPHETTTFGVLPTETTTPNVLPHETTKFSVLPVETTTLSVLPQETTIFSVLPTETTTPNVLPQETTAFSVLPTEATTDSVLPKETATFSVSHAESTIKTTATTTDIPDECQKPLVRSRKVAICHRDNLKRKNHRICDRFTFVSLPDVCAIYSTFYDQQGQCLGCPFYVSKYEICSSRCVKCSGWGCTGCPGFCTQHHRRNYYTETSPWLTHLVRYRDWF